MVQNANAGEVEKDKQTIKSAWSSPGGWGKGFSSLGSRETRGGGRREHSPLLKLPHRCCCPVMNKEFCFLLRDPVDWETEGCWGSAVSGWEPQSRQRTGGHEEHRQGSCRNLSRLLQQIYF